MYDDIEAVKAQVAEIVENSSPEVYILSKFNDPGNWTSDLLKMMLGDESVNKKNASAALLPLTLSNSKIQGKKIS